ncbi:glycosyltransferase [Streptococcus entericus]|uniref:glycosyltransferase n=1 Tax=Streptococcus entericus TaxID=155680 RepID=UPI00037EEE9E|nr:glycosyltransferase [Streptococcus entericus]
MKFSIIIAAYNVADYLEECVASVAQQIYQDQDYEILLINDGSTDGRTAALCDDLAKRYPVVRQIHKENGGLSSVRNLGILESKGDYILFVDGDDFWTDNQFLSGIAEHLSDNVDVLIFPYSYYSHKTVSLSYSVGDGASFNLEDNSVELVEKGIWFTPAWNKCVKRDLFEISDNLFFPLGFLSEDIIWCANLLKIAQTCVIYQNSQYMYRQNREGSITSTVKAKNVLDILRSIDQVLQTQGLSQERQVALERYATIAYISILPYAYPYRQDQDIKSYLQSYRYLLGNSRALHQLSFKMTGLGSYYLGLEVSMAIYHSLIGLYRRLR